MTTSAIDLERHPILAEDYTARCRQQLDDDGALVLTGFFTQSTIDRVVAESAPRETEAFYADSTHNVYLTAVDPDLDPSHPYNLQVASSKGLIADDQIPHDSPLRQVYEDATFRRFLSLVLGIDTIYPYSDKLSSINVHFASAGQELGWHFDNSSFAVTMLLQAPEAGGVFEYVPGVRNPGDDDMGFEGVAAILDGRASVRTLDFSPGDLVLFRGRNALHRITPTEGTVTRLLVVFAFNDQPGIGLSDSALMTFYGRTT